MWGNQVIDVTVTVGRNWQNWWVIFNSLVLDVLNHKIDNNDICSWITSKLQGIRGGSYVEENDAGVTIREFLTSAMLCSPCLILISLLP